MVRRHSAGFHWQALGPHVAIDDLVRLCIAEGMRRIRRSGLPCAALSDDGRETTSLLQQIFGLPHPAGLRPAAPNNDRTTTTQAASAVGASFCSFWSFTYRTLWVGSVLHFLVTQSYFMYLPSTIFPSGPSTVPVSSSLTTSLKSERSPNLPLNLARSRGVCSASFIMPRSAPN